jgi:thiol-disulfide isomerase/thioredoxin
MFAMKGRVAKSLLRMQYRNQKEGLYIAGMPFLARRSQSSIRFFAALALSAIALLLALLLVACDSKKKEGNAALQPGQIPEVSLTTLEGKTYSFGPEDKKVSLVVFWATWCQPCLMEIPSLVEFHTKYASRGFRVVSINIDDAEGQKMAAIYQKFDINYPMLMDDGTSDAKFGGIEALPTSFLIGRDGKVVKAFVGLYPAERVAQEILKAL